MVSKLKKESAGPGGYSYTFVSDVPKDYECPICLQVLRDPGLTECCGYNFCQSCIRQVQLSRGPCPRCKSARVRTVVNRQLRSTISALKVRCKYSQHGCNWSGALETVKDHINEGQVEGECQSAPLSCPLGCGAVIHRHSYQCHQKTLCRRRPHQCKYCGIKKRYDKILEHHEACTKYPVACPNQCGFTTERQLVNQHRNECPLEEVQCEFHFAGCIALVTRRDLQKHIEANTQKHISLLAKEVHQQQQINRQVRRKYREVVTQLTELEARCAENKAQVEEQQEDKHEELVGEITELWGEVIHNQMKCSCKRKVNEKSRDDERPAPKRLRQSLLKDVIDID